MTGIGHSPLHSACSRCFARVGRVWVWSPKAGWGPGQAEVSALVPKHTGVRTVYCRVNPRRLASKRPLPSQKTLCASPPLIPSRPSTAFLHRLGSRWMNQNDRPGHSPVGMSAGSRIPAFCRSAPGPDRPLRSAGHACRRGRVLPALRNAAYLPESAGCSACLKRPEMPSMACGMPTCGLWTVPAAGWRRRGRVGVG